MAYETSMSPYAVLCVDDEEHSLKYFRKIARRAFTALTASSGEEALEVLAREGDGIGIVFADQRMPGMKGVELLASVRASHPSIVRMLTSAWGDLEPAIEAVNTGGVHKYVVKPWDVRDLENLMRWELDCFAWRKGCEVLLQGSLDGVRRTRVADRIRSMVDLASGLSQRVAESMQSIKTFLDAVPARLAPAQKNPKPGIPTRGMLTSARRETARLLKITKRITDATVEPSGPLKSKVTLERLVGDAVAHATAGPSAPSSGITPRVTAGTATHRTRGKALAKMVGLLIGRVVGASGNAGPVEVTADGASQLHGSPASRITVSCMRAPSDIAAALATPFAVVGDNDADFGVDVVVAYSICQQHGGELTTCERPPRGPGFEVLLPHDPDSVRRIPSSIDSLSELMAPAEDLSPHLW